MSESHHPSMPHPDVARGQFLRVEKFAMQAPRGKSGGNTIGKVAQEAARTPGFCPHVEHPLPPTLLYGVGPLKAAEAAELWARAQTAQFVHKPSQSVMTRKFRADQACAVVGVISVPPEWTPGLRWTEFCEKSLSWLKEKYSATRLKSVLEHRDERCLHLHFWLIPLAGESLSSVHPGEKALDDVGRKAARIIRDAAYKKAMARLLDEFHEAVGRNFGLERQTVGGKRRTRADWLRNRYHEEQHELDILRRIDLAVVTAIDQLKLDLSNAQALEKVIAADTDKVGAAGRVSAMLCPAFSSSIAIGRAGPLHLSSLAHEGAGLGISANQQLSLQDRVPAEEVAPVTVSNARRTMVVADLGTQQCAAEWIRPRNR